MAKGQDHAMMNKEPANDLPIEEVTIFPVPAHLRCEAAAHTLMLQVPGSSSNKQDSSFHTYARARRQLVELTCECLRKLFETLTFPPI